MNIQRVYNELSKLPINESNNIHDLIENFKNKARKEMVILYINALHKFVKDTIDAEVFKKEIINAVNTINNNIKDLVDKYVILEAHGRQGGQSARLSSEQVKIIYEICLNLLTNVTGEILIGMINLYEGLENKLKSLDSYIIKTIIGPESYLIVKTKNLISHKMTLLLLSSEIYSDKTKIPVDAFSREIKDQDETVARILLKSDVFSMESVKVVEIAIINDLIVETASPLSNGVSPLSADAPSEDEAESEDDDEPPTTTYIQQINAQSTNIPTNISVNQDTVDAILKCFESSPSDQP